MIFSAGGVDLAIPDEWWAAAGMGIVAIIIRIGFAMTSKSRLLKAGGYAFAAALMAVSQRSQSLHHSKTTALHALTKSSVSCS